MGKYKNRGAQTVAEIALANLLKKIPQMEANYTEAMNRFARDQEAQDRYTRGVAMWTSVMRSPEVRNNIASVIRTAREKFYGMVSPEGYSTIPVTVRR